VNFNQVVAELLAQCRGGQGAAIVDPDGIPVAAHPRSATLEVLAAEFASILRGVGEAGRELSHGSLKQFWVSAENAEVIVTNMAGGYFLLLVLDPTGLTGRGRFLSRLAGERLHSEFV
jgi:predicted regulator of Ras-like GTPase activity (Roadblock/LC7/MglB family)